MLLAAIAGCSPVTGGTPTLSPTGTPAAAPSASGPGPGGASTDRRPGRPYTAADIERELADVPEEFPDRLRDPALAGAIADALWTYDGRPYAELWLLGSCSTNGACELTATGRPESGGEESSDVYFWQVPARSSTLVASGPPALKGYPPELASEVDGLVRSLDRDGVLTGLSLLGVEWAVPPPDDGYVARYGTGDEEGARVVQVLVDRSAGQILRIAEE